MATPAAQSKRMFQCGNCKAECSRIKSLVCGFCEMRFHAECVDGMTRHFFDSCKIGSSTFLCPTCKKISDTIDSTLKQTETKLALHEAKIVAMESRFLVVELERNALAEKVKIIEDAAVF